MSGQRSPWFGTLMELTVAPLLRLLFRVRAHGLENIPAAGAVLSGNHVSYLDPVLLWCVAPRRVHFMAKKEIFHGAFGWAVRGVSAFPVDRSGADRHAIATATELASGGELVGIFPEGTRKADGMDTEAHGGAAFVAIRAGVPIVPVGLVGTETAWPRGQKLPKFVKVTIACGEPLLPESFEGGRKERVDAMTAELMRRIADQVESARRLRDAR